MESRAVLDPEEHSIPDRVWEDLHAEIPRMCQRNYQVGCALNAGEVVRGCEDPERVVQLVYRWGLRRGLVDDHYGLLPGRWRMDEATFRLACARVGTPAQRGALAWMVMDERVDGDEEVLATLVSRRAQHLLWEAWKRWLGQVGRGQQFDHEGWREVAGEFDELSERVREVVEGLAPSWEGDVRGIVGAARQCVAVEDAELVGR